MYGKLFERKEYGTAFSGPYFPAFGLNTEKYADQKKNPYLNTFHAVTLIRNLTII